MKQSIVKVLAFLAEVALVSYACYHGLSMAFQVKDRSMLTWVAVLLAYLFVRSRGQKEPG